MFKLIPLAWLLIGSSLLFSTIYANNDGDREKEEPMPIFQWNKTYHLKHQGRKEMMKITFPDGGPDDFILLKHVNPLHIKNFVKKGKGAECIFSGHLMSDRKSAVSVTGCAMKYNNITVVLSTERLKHQMYLINNDIVKPVQLPKNLNDGNVGSNKSKFLRKLANMRGRLRKLPKQLRLTVSISPDLSFRRAYGKNRMWVEISKILNIAKPMMEWSGKRGIGSRIIIKPSKAIKPISGFVKSIKPVETWAAREPRNNHVYLAISSYPHPEMGGRVKEIATVCHPNKRMRAAVVYHPYKQSYFAGYTIAHELGHALGAWHDFVDPHSKPKKNKFDSQGRVCTNIGGVMDYNSSGEVTDKWSTCSRESFARYYTRIVNRHGRFCMRS